MRAEVAPRAFFLSGLLWFPIPIAAGFIALSATSLGVNVIDPNTVGPLVAGQVLGKVGAVLVFVVVFCSLASSIDSLLAATSDLLLQDFGKKILGISSEPSRFRLYSKFIIILLGFLTWVLCALEMDLLQILFLSGPLVASAIWPIIAGLYWNRAHWLAAVLAMLLGSALGLWAYFQIGWYTASLISAVVSMAVIFVSVPFCRQTFDWKKLHE
jgi:Na+/proline symporter